MRRYLLSAVLSMSILLSALATAYAASYTFTPLDVPGASRTVASGINDFGQIVGVYQDSSRQHGFLYTSGVFTSLDMPGAVGSTGAFGLIDLNNSSQIVGSYNASGETHGFLATPIRELAALNPAKVWIGLKNSDAVGLRIDLKAEVFVNQTKAGEGQLNNVASGSSGFNNAKLNTIPLTLFVPVEVPANATVKSTLSVRRTWFGGGHNSGTPRLWFNDSQANSRFGATIEDETSDFFLLDRFVLTTTPGPGPKKTIDVSVDNKAPCPDRPFKPFGAWGLTLP